MKKFLALLLVLCMIVPFVVACPSDTPDPDPKPGPTPTPDDPTVPTSTPYTYEEALGEYWKLYEVARAETEPAKRYALMAIAEAKLLESGTVLPTKAQGGNYAISRVVPYTAKKVLWGFDADRYQDILVADKLITAEDRAELKKMYNTSRATYLEDAKTYLTGKGYTLKNSYTIVYTSDPQTWDVLKTQKAADTRGIVNTIDSLMTYDYKGDLVPALAESYTVSEDGLTYTFTLREGLKWVTQQGQVYANLTAQDFVDGFKYVLDAGSKGLGSLLYGIIENATEYASGTATFDQVGVKATDERTVVYKLAVKTPYFTSMLAYNPLLPICKAYATEKGEDYGKDPGNILYCGPYLVKNYTAKNTIVFEKNPTYWNADNMSISKFTWLYTEGKDPLQTYNDAIKGTIDGSGLNSTSKKKAEEDGNFTKYAYVSSPDATTFAVFTNVNRQAYTTVGYDDLASTKTDMQKYTAYEALKNVHFRMALMHSVDRQAYNAAQVGEDAKLNGMQNLYTPGTFVKLPSDVTVKINGTDTTFKAGTYYGAIVQAQLTADGSKLKVWDPTGGDGDGSSSGFDGWYNVTAAREELAKALEELTALGITAENPIVLDLPYPAGVDAYTASSQAFKKSVEEALEGKVKINLVGGNGYMAWYSAGYLCEDAADCNYDFYDCSGWGPDFGDPSTYLDTFMPGGYMTMMLGF